MTIFGQSTIPDANRTTSPNPPAVKTPAVSSSTILKPSSIISTPATQKTAPSVVVKASDTVKNGILVFFSLGLLAVVATFAVMRLLNRGYLPSLNKYVKRFRKAHMEEYEFTEIIPHQDELDSLAFDNELLFEADDE
jgi:hypothetical protein